MRCAVAALLLGLLNFTEGEHNDTITEELADVAQLVEQLIRNQQVIGSSPIVGSIQHLSTPLHRVGQRLQLFNQRISHAIEFVYPCECGVHSLLRLLSK